MFGCGEEERVLDREEILNDGEEGRGKICALALACIKIADGEKSEMRGEK